MAAGVNLQIVVQYIRFVLNVTGMYMCVYNYRREYCIHTYI